MKSNLLTLLGLVVLTASAAPQCQIPTNLPKPSVPARDMNRMTVTDYQFVLSWSPNHCQQVSEQHLNGTRAWDRAFQCEKNHFGFVVHGLWPQAKGSSGKNNSPRSCEPSKRLPESLLEKNLCTVPGVALMQNEWSEHGTCMTDDPEKYFSQIQSLASRFKPGAIQLSPGVHTAAEVRDAVAAVNPALLRREHIGVRATKDQKLQEIYICLEKNLQPMTCPKVGTADNTTLTVES
jgi:ribonuclease T2